MLRVLYADTRKLLFHGGLRECLLAVTGCLAGYVLLLMLVGHFMDGELLVSDVHGCYASFAVFLVTASTLMTTISDFTDGCIRNKLISGAGRTAVFLAAEISGIIQALILSAAACVVTLLLSIPLSQGPVHMTAADIAQLWFVNTLACVSIAVFTTALIMVLGGKKGAFTTGICIAIVMKIVSMEVLDKLYPAQGACSLSETKLALYSFYDCFVPYAYLGMAPHHEMWVYLAGSLGLILISTLAGLMLFRRKEIQ